MGKKVKFRNIQEEEKEKYFKENYPFADPPELSDIVKCIHCEQKIRVGDFKVEIDRQGIEYIVCPNSPECDGTVVDWHSAEDFE